jgi:hypothetical protein
VLGGRKVVDWVPVDVAAAAVAELLLSGSGKEGMEGGGEGERYVVHNIVNPNPISWSEMLGLLQESSLAGVKEGKLEEVSMKEWVARLNAVADREDVPGLRLLAFFEEMVDDESASKVFETAKSREVSRSLRECKPMCWEWIEGNVRVWRESGFL